MTAKSSHCFFTGIDQLFIGLSDREIEGQYKWSDDETAPLLEGWGTDEPSGGSTENCVVITEYRSWKWADVKCDGPFPFICEK